jgi:hypothetical protein
MEDITTFRVRIRIRSRGGRTVPIGFVALLLDQRASLLARLEVSAKDLSARGAQLLADQRLDGLRLVAAAPLVVWRIGHYRQIPPPPWAKPGAVRARAGTLSRSR